jgi:hypothetical protein
MRKRVMGLKEKKSERVYIAKEYAGSSFFVPFFS